MGYYVHVATMLQTRPRRVYGAPSLERRQHDDAASRHDMDRRFAATHTMSEHASRQYLAWAGSLRRALQTLGMAATPPPVPAAMTLAEHLALRAAEREAAMQPSAGSAA